jgi:23S rRNA pseudouridine1911/1915/1917 synthase
MPCLSLKTGETDTLAAWLIKRFSRQAEIGRPLEAGLVHRLDNDTSGLVVAARTSEAYETLRTQFSNPPLPPFTKGGDAKLSPLLQRGVRGDLKVCKTGNFGILKAYTALVIGNPPNEGTITTPIAHHPRKKKKMVVCKSAVQAKALKARPAITSFEVLKRYKSSHDRRRVSGNQCPTPPSAYSLLRVRIATGVRHQIRVHLASIGFPIAGDRLYQNPKKRAEDTLSLKRHFLHASQIGFTHPKTGKWIEVKSALPDELKEVLALCRRV